MKDNSQELLPIVDESGHVTGSATRGECHSGTGLLHPVVHLHVFDPAGRIFLQRRPLWKDIQPGKWDTAVGGHVDLGEETPAALIREAREELGLTGFTPETIARYVFESPRERELVNVFAATVAEDAPHPSDELDGGRFFTIREVEENLGKDLFTPNFEQEYREVVRPWLESRGEPKIYAAPMQGYTDEVWRHLHNALFGGIDAYFTPFMRVERGEVRPRDVRGITSELNKGLTLVPQVIFRDADELDMLTRAVAEAGYTRFDLNLGCPFPPQVKHGRGAALITRPEVLREAADLLRECYPELSCSVKMRLGINDPGEWRQTIDVLNDMPLTEITIHPRIARQQYSGELFMDAFREFAAASKHPVVFNGDLHTPEQIADVLTANPSLRGVMLGRGLLARPTLAAEYRGMEYRPGTDALTQILQFHDSILNYYRSTLCGDAQILLKIKPFWDYLEPLIGHRAAKQIRKAASMPKYLSAVASI